MLCSRANILLRAGAAAVSRAVRHTSTSRCPADLACYPGTHSSPRPAGGARSYRVSLTDQPDRLCQVRRPASESAQTELHYWRADPSSAPTAEQVCHEHDRLDQDRGLDAMQRGLQALGRTGRQLAALPLPRGFPHSVHAGYTRFAAGHALAMAASCAAGVLATQAMFMAMGIGPAAAGAAAAAVNWVLKDGLGQAGGVVAASMINTRLDVNPARWRMLSGVLMDAACVVEALSPLAPGAFLLLAGTANMAKNVAWLVSSGARAGMHAALAKAGNLADITAKAGSQTLMASVVGTAAGAGLATAVAGSTAYTAGAVVCLAVVHQVLLYHAVQAVPMRTLNFPRLHLAWQPSAGEPARTPEEVQARVEQLGVLALLQDTTGPANIELAPPMQSLAADSLRSALQAHTSSPMRAQHGCIMVPQACGGGLRIALLPLEGADHAAIVRSALCALQVLHGQPAQQRSTAAVLQALYAVPAEELASGVASLIAAGWDVHTPAMVPPT